MGYFANIVKDSRLNPAGSRSALTRLPDIDGQALPAGMAETIPDSPPRRSVGQKRPAREETRLAPAAADPIKPLTASVEKVSARQANSKPLPLVKTLQENRLPSSVGGVHPELGGPIEATDAQAAIPVIQRQVFSDAEPRSSVATGPRVSGSRQPDRSSRGRLAVERPASQRRSPSSRLPGAAADPLVQELSPHRALSAGERREKMHRPLAQPIEPENSAIKKEAPPPAELSARPAGQANRSTAADAPAPARLKGTNTKPALPVASFGSVQAIENISSASGGRIDLPRVQIGQVNVIVEESRLPPKSPPGDLRRDDSASRTFLRSL